MKKMEIIFVLILLFYNRICMCNYPSAVIIMLLHCI